VVCVFPLCSIHRSRTRGGRCTEPGDYLLVYHTNANEPVGTRLRYLDHVALFIDDDVYFERAGAGDHVPFRLIDWRTLSTVWTPLVFSYEVRRPINYVPFSSTADAFGLHNHVTLAALPALAAWTNATVAAAFAATPELERDASDPEKIVKIDSVTYVWMRDTDALQFTDVDEQSGRASLPPSAFDEHDLLPVGVQTC
jgi:hypothetical protein